VKSRGTLRVIVAADEALTFAGLQGVAVEVVPAKTYADRIPLLLVGKGDTIVAILDTAERRQQVAFTAEVMPTYSVAVTLSPKRRSFPRCHGVRVDLR
jgi:ABC-type amino acid transport substrate-binding protein